ncbi:MAG TPA: ATP-binding cassette domain-containing protein [Candidatus Saccharimonadales bacterium]|nr:ATP-binding cassette domain-containing protein [Candidatus Saccharimonadales bacterium]
MAKTDYVIAADNLQKAYGKNEVLKGVNLQVQRGTMLALLGPNGAGKTTTVRILSTLLTPDSGTVTVDGYDVVKQADEVRGVIGLTGQYAAVDELLTGRENLLMMGRLYHLSKAVSKQRAEELLEQFDLVDAANRTVKTYSGGMRRRLDLAVSLIATPPIIFLDEPTTGLDPRSRLAMWDVIKRLKRDGATILLTTQYLEEADQLADKIAVIDGGTVIAEGTADELKQKVGKERLELIVAKASDFAQARKLIDGEALRHDEEKRSISVAIDGGATHVRQILEAMDKANITIEGLSLHKPTLDDVFLTLTGKQVSKEEEAEQAEAKKGKK